MGIPIMIVGTSSDAGKTLISTVICNHLTELGFKVAPFKMQNMSLNSMCSIEGGEMSVAQYIQAIACKKLPSVRFNPILLKPENGKTYVIFNGKYYNKYSPKDYMSDRKKEFFDKGINILNQLLDENDYVIIEGAGSPAEVNLMKYDITNMAVAKAVKAHTIIVTDINLGGSFASIVGTMEIFNEEEKNLVKGFIFNKYYGKKEMLDDGLKYLLDKYNKPTLGIVPYAKHNIPDEDSMKKWNFESGDIDIRIIKTPHISNFADFDPLSWKNGIKYIEKPDNSIPDLLIIPGSKSTVEDLKWLRINGFDDYILKCKQNNSIIMGICGGFQMLTENIEDNFENNENIEGIGLIPLKTIFKKEKITGIKKGYLNFLNSNYDIEGFEIRHGHTETNDHYFCTIKDINGDEYKDGFIKENVIGTYMHGLFNNDHFTDDFLNFLRTKKGLSIKKYNSYSLYDQINNFSKEISKHINFEDILSWH
ncbi:cobyric acid synthase [Oceanotoga teriensis]|uniref:cobyric acid synthase n=1 Tax=Oceanotoga teriensis TaxID=515440 RepID=UPI0027134B16|nr:cobyric acid synthase [Oceanotoga teriensis]MDO7975339.1 cobyric acid synthase [Oceanotoga teriensis]